MNLSSHFDRIAAPAEEVIAGDEGETIPYIRAFLIDRLGEAIGDQKERTLE
jgi:hypothetical protein